MADTEGSRGEGDLPGVRGEPEPDWVDGIRRGREERAERLKSLLGPAPPVNGAQGEPPAVGDEVAGAEEREPLADVPETPA